MKKISLSVVAMVLVLALLLSACSNSDNQSQGNTNNKVPASSSGSLTETPTAKAAEDVVYDIVWAGGPQYPFEDNTYGQKFMEDTFNINIKIVRADNAEKLNLLVSTGEIPDLIVPENKSDLSNFIRNDVLAEIPLEMIQQYAPDYYDIVMKQYDRAFDDNKVNGKNYVLPVIEANQAPWPVAIRGDWLINVGAEIPTTLQELEDVFVKFRNDDPDRNGKKDTYALTMASDTDNRWFHTIFGAYGTNPFMWHERDGELVYGFGLPETKEALKLLAKWKEIDLIDPEFITDKRRTSGMDDVTYKFASGRVGYLDTLSYADHQWDNDGHLNAKWVSLHEEWGKFFEGYEAYDIAPFTELTTDGPQPVYINIAPPIGPDGQSGAYIGTKVKSYILFGKQVAEDEGKMIRMLKMINRMISDEEVAVGIEIGEEGVTWEWNENGQRVAKAEFLTSDQYHPQGRIIGTGLFFDLTYSSNPDFLAMFGGPRAIQRYELTKNAITQIPGISNALQAPLESEGKYGDIKAIVQEYIMKAILGEVDIDATYDDAVQKWMTAGGDVLMKEANEWYASTK